MTTSHYRNTIYIAYYLSLSLFFITSAAATHSLIRQFNTNLLQKERAAPNPNLEEVSASSIMKGLRVRSPSTYSLKMESFDTLINSTVVDKYETRPFSAVGYSWTLIVYPNGNKQDNGSGYLSLYIAIDKASLDASTETDVDADIRFYIFNNNERKYFTIRDTCLWQFNAFNTTFGFSQVLPVDTVKDPTNGYLTNQGQCQFGVDVTIPTPYRNYEVLHVPNDSGKYTWSVSGRDLRSYSVIQTDEFNIINREWKLQIHTNGGGSGEGKAVSLFLIPIQSYGYYEVIYIRGKLRVLNQLNLNNIEMPFDGFFGRFFEPESHQYIMSPNPGSDEFISFADLNDSSKGFLVNDVLLVEVELDKASSPIYI